MASVSAEPRHPAVLAILLAALVLTGCAEREEPAPGPPAAKAAVDGERIANADSEPGSWLSHGRTYSEQRFSPLTQITRDNVGRLGLAWYADLDTRRGQEATPLMVDGVIYVSTAWSKVKAYDAKTGREIWAFDPQVPGEWAVNACCDVVNRGVAVWQGKVFVGTLDGRLIALDAATGDKLWDVTTIDRSLPYTITGAPRVVKGKVLIGNGGAEFGVRGYVSAYDADSGEMAWRFYTVPGDPAKGFEQPILEKAAETWSGQWWRLGGGGTVWDSMAYDPGLDLLYIGTGNGSPWNHSLRSEGKGDNLFLASIVALRPDTGEYVWHYQSTPGENWDHTATQQITIADLTIDGRKRHVLMQLPKNGFFYVIDAATGKLISAKNVTEIAWATHVDIATGRPVENPAARYDVTGKPFVSTHNPMGVHTWHSMSYSPQTGLVYLPIHGTPFVFGRPESFNPTGMAMNTGADHSAMATMDAADVLAKTYGRLIAWDPVNQKEAWRVERAGQANGGALSTAGGLVFQGTGSGELTALDAATGASLWSAPTQTGVVAAPISYSVDGEQYVAIMVGTGGLWAMVGGGANMKGVKLPNVSRLLVYKLGGTVQLPAERAVTALPIDPPANEAAGEVIGRGAARYRTFCASCHGAGAVGVGLLPDLRRTPFLRSEQAWENVVLGGAFKAHGMASFEKVIDADDAKAIRQFVILRANQDKPAAAAAQ